MSPGLSAGCFGCYVNLATCSGPDCYANFNTCAGFPVDFARAIYNEPRFECLGAGCLRGAGMGEPCEKPGDCASQQCTSLPHAPAAKVCTASDGSMCYADSPFCGSCQLGTDNYYGSGHCGACFTTGRIESGNGQCFRDCSTTSYCMAGQMCRYFSNSDSERYCD